MRSIVINLPTDEQRLESFQRAYPSSVLPPLEVWRAKSGADVDVPDWWKKSANRYALAVNFADILDAVGEEDVWIWEDDAIFAPNFETHFPAFMRQVPDDAGMVFLGGYHFGIPVRISSLCMRLRASWCGHAILYKAGITKMFADYLREPAWGCSHYSDQRRAQIINSGKIVAYCSFGNLSGQAEGYSNLDNYVRHERWYNTFKFVDLDGRIKQMRNGVILCQQV